MTVLRRRNFNLIVRFNRKIKKIQQQTSNATDAQYMNTGSMPKYECVSVSEVIILRDTLGRSF